MKKIKINHIGKVTPGSSTITKAYTCYLAENGQLELTESQVEIPMPGVKALEIGCFILSDGATLSLAGVKLQATGGSISFFIKDGKLVIKSDKKPLSE